MERIQQIIAHPDFGSAYERTVQWEQQREFCRHEIGHYLDVARIAYIWNLEQQTGLDKEIIYAAALLHDIGRYQQYEDGIPHEQAGATLAAPILADCGFTAAEQEQILAAIRSHRGSTGASAPLNRLLYEADKRSRNCGFCPAVDACSWSEDKKNKEIIV